MIRKLALAAVLALGISPALAAQNTLITPGSPLTMAGLATFLNNAFQSVATNYSGATPPAVCAGGTACTYQFWLDTSTSPRVLRIYDATNWVSIGSLDTSGHSFSIATSEISTARSGSTDTIADADRGSLVRYTNASSTAVALPQAGAAGAFASGWFADVRAASTGTVTITPATSTINGAATLVLPPGLSVRIISDGSNYFTTQTIGTPTTSVLGGVFSKAAVSSNWLRSLGTDGIFTASQPTFTDISGTALATQGGTGLTTYALGDIIYGSGVNTLAALSGNTTTTRKFLRQTGTGAVSAIPAWDTIVAADIPGSALTKTDDTNVTLTLGGSPTTALLNAASITVGWTGTLAAGRLNSNVVQSITNDTNVTGTISAQNLTLGWTGTLALSRLAQGTDGQIIVGQTSAAPLYKTVTGDITLSAAGVVALVNIPSATPMAGSLLATNVAAPGTPASTKTSIYVDSTDKRLHDKNDAGTIGTTVVADTGTSNNFLTAVSTAGVISKARPTCANLSDSTSSCSTANASINTASTLVARDGSGNFAAGTITAALSGNASTATALQTARAIYGNNFDGTAALTQVIASTYGGTGNGFTKFTGPTTAEKSFALPDASATILTTNAAVTVAQGGTGQTTALAARGSSGLNIDSCTSVGDTNGTIVAADRCYYHTALSAARTDTLPAANSVNAGQVFYLTDFRGVATASNTITLQRAGSDTINGGATVVAVAAQYGAGIFWSDGVSRWTFMPAGSGGGGSGTVTQIIASNGLDGGTITTSGTISAGYRRSFLFPL